MFFDEVPPDTSIYMIAGYVIFFVVTAIYLASLVVRHRNLNRDLQTLQGLEEEQAREAAAMPARAAAKPRTSRSKTARARSKRKKSSQNR